MNDPALTLDRIFHPKSVAIVGASENLVKMGARCVQSLMEIGFEGDIYPIDPTNAEVDTIFGLKAYSSLVDVPGDVDLVIVAVPARFVSDTLRAAAEKNAAGAVVISAGFREIEDESGARLEEEITRIADEAGIKIIGPNTFGMVNMGAKLNASFTPPFSSLIPGNISMLGQSGGVCHLIAFQAIDENIGMNKIVGLGNRCNLGFPELVDYIADDDETDTLILYIEGIEEPRPLMEAAKALSPKKPIVGLKVGKSEAASRAVQSHTGSLSGRHELYYAGFEQAGIVPAHDTVELLDIAKILNIAKPPAGRRVAVMTFQAGPGIMLTDLCESHNLEMAQLSDDTIAKLKNLWPDLTIRSNPVDLAFLSDMGAFGEAAGLVIEDENVDSLIVFYLDVMSFFTAVLSDQLIELARGSEKPVIVCANYPAKLSGGESEPGLARLEENGIAVYPLPARAVKALKGLVRRGEIERNFG
jgi:acyl-CoA synthetase (NDP forming)